MKEIYTILKSKSSKPRWKVHAPTVNEVYSCQSDMKVQFPREYIEFLLHASDIRFGEIEPVQLTAPENENYLPTVFSKLEERKNKLSLHGTYYPLSMNLGDFFCLTEELDVIFIGRNHVADYSWESIEDWMAKIWLTSEFKIKQGV